jgi:galactonate dehydratase
MAKIKSIEYFRVKPRWLLVKITDENGQFGWGEATLEGHDLAVEGCLEEMIPRVIGREAKYAGPQNFCRPATDQVTVLQ